MRRLAAAAFVLTLAGCGSQAQPTVVVTRTVLVSPVTCDRFLQGTAVSVQVSGPNASDVCQQVTRKLAGFGFWTRLGTRSGDKVPACALIRGDLRATVYDIDGGSIGSDVCADFAAAGWTEPDE